MEKYEDLYLISDGSSDGRASVYSEALLVPVETLDDPIQEALANGSFPLAHILKGTKVKAIPIWRLVEKLEEHDLFRELFDEFISTGETKDT